MDIEIADQQPIRQATDDDLQGVFAGDVELPLTLARNYGDRLEATAAGGGDGYRLAFYEAVTGRWQEAGGALSRTQLKDAFLDFFEGKWNWYNHHEWRTIKRSR